MRSMRTIGKMWNPENEIWDVRNGKSEVRNEVLECSHPISHFPHGFLWQKIELGPEKWEMGFKWGFSRLKCGPQVCVMHSNWGRLFPKIIKVGNVRSGKWGCMKFFKARESARQCHLYPSTSHAIFIGQARTICTVIRKEIPLGNINLCRIQYAAKFPLWTQNLSPQMWKELWVSTLTCTGCSPSRGCAPGRRRTRAGTDSSGSGWTAGRRAPVIEAIN